MDPGVVLRHHVKVKSLSTSEHMESYPSSSNPLASYVLSVGPNTFQRNSLC